MSKGKRRGKGVADIDTAEQGKLLIEALKGKEKEDSQLPNHLWRILTPEGKSCHSLFDWQETNFRVKKVQIT